MFPAASMACHVRVATIIVGLVRLAMFVTVLRTLTVTGLQLSAALGLPKLHGWPAITVRFGLMVKLGGVVSSTWIKYEPVLVLPQASRATQLRVMVK
jgi:hypothetical protein